MKQEDENKKADYAIWAVFVFTMVVLLWGTTACKKIQYIQGETIYKEVKVIEHDTTLVTEADTASINALMHCDSAYNVVLDELNAENGARIRAEAKLKTREVGQMKFTILEVECKEDSLEQVVHLKDSIIKEITERNIIELEKAKKENTQFAKFCIRYFWTTASIMVLLIALFVYRKLR